MATFTEADIKLESITFNREGGKLAVQVTGYTRTDSGENVRYFDVELSPEFSPAEKTQLQNMVTNLTAKIKTKFGLT